MATVSRRSALASYDFRLLLVGQLISLIGTQMKLVAVAWQLYLLTHSPLALGLLGLARIAPVILLALGGGVVADAFDRRRLMIVTQSALALSSLVLAAATHASVMRPSILYAVSFAAGAANAFDNPARQALLPRLVTRAELPSALSLSAMAWQLATIIGPSVAGFLIAVRGVAPIYTIDAISYGAVIAALLAMRHREEAIGASAVSLRAAVDGLRFLARTRLILSTMLLDFFATFFAGSMLLMPIFADALLHVGARGLGWLYAAQPVGAALAALFLSLAPPLRRQGRAVLLSVAVYGVAIAVFGASRSLAVSLIALAASGAADTVSMVLRQTLRQLLTPDELRGRMTSVNMIFFAGGPQLGEVEAGMAAQWFGARASVVSGGLLCVATALVVALLVPALRRYLGEPKPDDH